ncbi:MAG: DUF502 domain-containing protein [Zetaproteobacteria bacterium]|nr:MAG: DUF502 domain-containing protein [Zetaproteobacteria bacterium]
MRARPFFLRLRRWFLAGVLALLPLFLVVVLVRWLLRLGNTLVGLLPEALQLPPALEPEAPLFGVLMALVAILGVGALTTRLLGARVMRTIDRIAERIPIVNTLHRATRQLLSAVLHEDAEAFQQVVLVPFPSRDTRVIGFITGYARAAGGHKLAAVFVPSTPVPTTGWLMFVAPELLEPLPISIDDAMKLVLSGGALAAEVWRR